eukprot:CAMPEP_0170095218 /NCGR_PEP_ID=MMETSP0019_2-20121128/27786_1 /TAXON_ID=98059 /ORGANISM="Dinobryon sp., Strain UTEXLB2267" /LENGTH=413 /DNA_ID=CAMNT_0010316829 /DNA_START=129 /DNA_END=1368 /DNA_ORIENTATION=+
MKYDHRDLPIQQKSGVTIGMSMTEKQGGSDVRLNTTTASPIESHRQGPGCSYSLRGHKWFTSAPMSDAFLTLAKVAGSEALSCFIVPRWLPDGSRNEGFRVMRLKDKLADRANASSEVEYEGAWAQMIGGEGLGVKTIIEMVQSTRLDCTLGSAAGARRALQQQCIIVKADIRVGPHRAAPDEEPAGGPVVEAEAHTMLAFHMASAFDKWHNEGSEADRDVFRIGVSVSKYFVTKRLPALTYECLEVFGGNGFVEDFPMSRLFRHSPLNSIWEGSGNVIALDVLRGSKQLPMLWKDILLCEGADSGLDQYLKVLERDIQKLLKMNPLEAQRHARNLVDRLAMAMEASALIRFGDSKVAESFIDILLCEGADAGLDQYLKALERDVQKLLNMNLLEAQRHARNLVDRLAMAMEA